MAKITVLGGCGAVGSVAVQTLVKSGEFFEIVIGDINVEKANELISNIGNSKIIAVKVEANDPNSIREAIKGSDVVLNCIGPFYKYASMILKVAIENKINYVDVCDDYDATLDLLEMHNMAKNADITALIGMGSSPGIANLLAKYCADEMLDEVEAIDIFHAHGGEKIEGAAVVAHRIHSMLMDIPVYLNGEMKTVKLFEDDGIALEEEVDFLHVGRFRIYMYPHPETLTLPKYIPGLKRVTNKGIVLPPEYANLIKSIVKAGIVDEDPIDVQGQSVSPFEFALAYIINKRTEILERTKFGSERGCAKIVVEGKKEGKPHKYEFSLASEEQGMGQGTGIPAALGSIMMVKGLIQVKGVLPPEGCVDSKIFLKLIQDALQIDKIGQVGTPLTIESIDTKGNRTNVML